MSIFPDKTVQDVLAAIDPVKLLRMIGYRVDTLQEIQDLVKCFCPIHREAVFRTLIVSKTDKDYKCSYSLCPGNNGGSLIDLYARVKEITFDEALQELVEELHLRVELPPAREIIARTLEEGENFLYLLKTDDTRHDMYLEEALKRFQRVLDVDPNHPGALKGLYQVMEFKRETDRLPALSRRRIEVESKAGRLEEVTAICRDHLAHNPNDLDIRRKLIENLLALEQEDDASGELMMLADLCESTGDFDGAIEAYRQVARLDVVDIDVHPMIVNLLRTAGRPREAVEECMGRASALSERGQVAEAVEVLRGALDVDPERDDIRARLVEYSLLLGLDSQRVTEALTLIDEMIGRNSLDAASQALQVLCDADPSNPHLLDKLIEVKKRQGRAEEALALQYRLADLYRDQEDYASAILLLEEVATTTGGALEALKRIAAINRLEGDNPQAVKVYYQIIDRAREQIQLDEAIAAGETIVEIQPDDLDHREQLIRLYIEAGRNEVALERILALVEALEPLGDVDRLVAQLRSALQLAPGRTDLRLKLAEALDGLGEIDHAQIERMEAARHFIEGGHHAEAIGQLEVVLSRSREDRGALALLAQALACSGKTDESNSLLLRLASLHIADQKYGEARDTLELLLKQAPDHAQALVQLADVYTGLGDEAMLVATLERIVTLHLQRQEWEEAQKQSQAILDLRRDHVGAHRALVQVHEARGHPQEAIQTLFRLAGIFRSGNQPREEQEALESVLEREPWNRQAMRRLAELSLELSEPDRALQQLDRYMAAALETQAFDEAIEFLRSLLARHPGQIDFHHRLIDLLEEAGRPAEVVAQLQTLIEIHQERQSLEPIVDLYCRILDLEPETIAPRVSLIDALLRLERKADAVEQYLRLSEVHQRQNRPEEAERTAEDILKIDPRNEGAYRRLVELARARGDKDKAILWLGQLVEQFVQAEKADLAVATLREILQIDPLHIDSRRRLIGLQARLGNLDLAVAESMTLVDTFRQAGDFPNAAAAQRDAIALLPDSSDLRRGLINLLIEEGEIAKAIEELFSLAELFRRKEAHEEALNTLAQLLEFDPNNLRARKQRGEIYANTGREKEALQELLALTEKLENPEILRALGRPPVSELPEQLPLLPEYTFETFVVGDRNNFAYATALATAKAPARHYNPLFLYSEVGLGKTHLLHAIGNYILANNPKFRLLYTTSEEFTSHIIDAIQANAVTQFRQAHRDVDVLLLDDVQFLAGKERAQEEFFHIFNTLFQAKKQIVVTSDRPPKDIAHLEKRLKSRFGAGVVVDMQAPDFETRTAIIKREVQAWPEVGFTPDIISLIAQKIESNVRELKGALKQIVAAREHQGESLTSDSVTRILDQLLARV